MPPMSNGISRALTMVSHLKVLSPREEALAAVGAFTDSVADCMENWSAFCKGRLGSYGP